MRNHALAAFYLIVMSVGYALSYTVVSSSPSGKTMAALSAWWLCLYISKLANIRPLITIYVVAYISVISIVDYFLGFGVFRPKGGSIVSQLAATLIGATIYIAPIFINHAVSYFWQKLKRTDSGADHD